MVNIANYKSNYYYDSQGNTIGKKGAAPCSGALVGSGCHVASCSGTIDKLSIETLVKKFVEGNLEVNELFAGLSAKGVKEVTKETLNDSKIKITFTYSGKKYQAICTKEAADSQTDNNIVNVKTYTELHSKSGYGFSDEEIAKYFVASSTVGGKTTNYSVKTSTGCKTISDVQKAVNKERAKAQAVVNKYAQQFTSGSLTVEEFLEKLGEDVSVTQTTKNDVLTLKFYTCGKAYSVTCENAKRKTYTSAELVKKFNMAYGDIAKYMKPLNGGYVINYDAVKQAVPNTDLSRVLTVDDLLDALSEQKLSSANQSGGIVHNGKVYPVLNANHYGLPSKYFIDTSYLIDPTKYVSAIVQDDSGNLVVNRASYAKLNIEQIEKDFPGQNIRTIEQLKEAVTGGISTLAIGNIDTYLAQRPMLKGIITITDRTYGTFKIDYDKARELYPKAEINSLDDLLAAVDRYTANVNTYAVATRGDFPEFKTEEEALQAARNAFDKFMQKHPELKDHNNAALFRFDCVVNGKFMMYTTSQFQNPANEGKHGFGTSNDGLGRIMGSDNIRGNDNYDSTSSIDEDVNVLNDYLLGEIRNWKKTGNLKWVGSNTSYYVYRQAPLNMINHLILTGELEDKSPIEFKFFNTGKPTEINGKKYYPEEQYTIHREVDENGAVMMWMEGTAAKQTGTYCDENGNKYKLKQGKLFPLNFASAAEKVNVSQIDRQNLTVKTAKTIKK